MVKLNSMKTYSPEYIEAFVKECFDQNIPVEKAAALYDKAVRADLLNNNESYREGFYEMIKSAENYDFVDEASAVMSPFQRGAIPGAILGGAAALSLPLIFRTKNIAKSLFKGLSKKQPITKNTIPQLLKNQGGLASNSTIPWWGRMTGGAVGGGLAGGALSQFQAEKALTLSPDLPYIPVEFQDALYSGGNVNDVKLGVRGIGPTASSVFDSKLRSYKNQLASIESDLARLRSEAQRFRLSNNLRDQLKFNKLTQEINELEKQRQAVINSSSRIIGGLNRNMARSKSELARYQAELERAKSSLNPEAAAAFLRSQAEDTTWGGVAKRIWGRVFGGITNAEKQLAQANQLQAKLDQIQKLQALMEQ
jgi:hypothetical protein